MNDSRVGFYPVINISIKSVSKMNKKTIAKALGITVIAGAMLLGGRALVHVFAATEVTYPTPIANIAKVFNLDPAKVQTAFEQGRAQEQETRLADLVTAGKLTTAQKDKLTELHNKADAKRSELLAKGLTREEMRTQMASIHDEIRSYVESQNLTSVLPGRGNVRGIGRGMGMRP